VERKSLGGMRTAITPHLHGKKVSLTLIFARRCSAEALGAGVISRELALRVVRVESPVAFDDRKHQSCRRRCFRWFVFEPTEPELACHLPKEVGFSRFLLATLELVQLSASNPYVLALSSACAVLKDSPALK